VASRDLASSVIENDIPNESLVAARRVQRQLVRLQRVPCVVERFNHLANINIFHKLQAISRPEVLDRELHHFRPRRRFFTVDG
jgi:hypothetical protein